MDFSSYTLYQEHCTFMFDLFSLEYHPETKALVKV